MGYKRITTWNGTTTLNYVDHIMHWGWCLKSATSHKMSQEFTLHRKKGKYGYQTWQFLCNINIVVFQPQEVNIWLAFNILKRIYKLHLLEMRFNFLHNLFTNSAFLFNSFNVLLVDKGFGGLGVSCWPLVPKFAGSNPAEAVGFLRGEKNPQHAFLRRGSKAVGPMS